MAFLFKLSEYDHVFKRFVGNAIRGFQQHHPVLGKIKTEIAETVPATLNTMPTGEVIVIQPRKMLVDLSLDLKDVVSGDIDPFISSIYDASEQGSRQMLEHMFQTINTLSGGTAIIKIPNDQPLSFDQFLECLDKTDISFDEHGNPDFSPIMIVSTRTGQPVPIPLPTTEEQVQRFNALIKRKREEHNDRRRSRKLS